MRFFLCFIAESCRRLLAIAQQMGSTPSSGTARYTGISSTVSPLPPVRIPKRLRRRKVGEGVLRMNLCYAEHLDVDAEGATHASMPEIQKPSWHNNAETRISTERIYPKENRRTRYVHRVLHTLLLTLSSSGKFEVDTAQLSYYQHQSATLRSKMGSRKNEYAHETYPA